MEVKDGLYWLKLIVVLQFDTWELLSPPVSIIIGIGVFDLFQQLLSFWSRLLEAR